MPVVDDDGVMIGWAYFRLLSVEGGSDKVITGYFVSPVNGEELVVNGGHKSGELFTGGVLGAPHQLAVSPRDATSPGPPVRGSLLFGSADSSVVRKVDSGDAVADLDLHRRGISHEALNRQPFDRVRARAGGRPRTGRRRRSLRWRPRSPRRPE